MATALCSPSFKLDNDYLADYGVYLGQEGGLPGEIFMPDVDNYAETIPNAHGGVWYNQVYKPRVIKLQCFVIEMTEDVRNDIIRLLSFKQPKKLILDQRPYRYIWVQPNNQVDWNFIWNSNNYDQDMYGGFFELSFVAYDPFYYSLFDSTNAGGYIEDFPTYPTLYFEAGMLWVEDIPDATLSAITGSTSFQLYNGGNYDSTLKVTLVGTCTNVTITNSTRGESFTIAPMASETIIVDGAKSQISNGIILKTSKFTGDFIKISRGWNSFTITGSGLNLSSATFLHKYTYI